MRGEKRHTKSDRETRERFGEERRDIRRVTEKQEREIWRGEKRHTKSDRETRERFGEERRDIRRVTEKQERDLERREEIYEE